MRTSTSINNFIVNNVEGGYNVVCQTVSFLTLYSIYNVYALSLV
jgi:hypothetical protein